MACFKLGSFITEARGKLGGQSLQMQGGRCFALTSHKPRKKNVLYTPYYNQKHNQVLYAWKNLSTTNKLLWNTFAKSQLAKNYYPDSESWSGFNWFYSCNKNYWPSAIINFLTPPATLSHNILFNYSATMSSVNGYVTISYSCKSSASTYLMLFASAPSSAGKSKKKDMYRFIQFGVVGANPNVQAFTNYNVAYGYRPRSGSTIFLKLILFSFANGLKSVPYFLKITVT